MTQQFDELLIRVDRCSAEAAALSTHFQELREQIRQAISIAQLDPEMSLARSRKVLEYIVRDVYDEALKPKRAGTQPLEGLVQALVKQGHFPTRLAAYADMVRGLGNVGVHTFDKAVGPQDVLSSLTSLMPIIEWFFEQRNAAGAPPVGRAARDQPSDGGNAPEPRVAPVASEPQKSTVVEAVPGGASHHAPAPQLTQEHGWPRAADAHPSAPPQPPGAPAQRRAIAVPGDGPSTDAPAPRRVQSLAASGTDVAPLMRPPHATPPAAQPSTTTGEGRSATVRRGSTPGKRDIFMQVMRIWIAMAIFGLVELAYEAFSGGGAMVFMLVLNIGLWSLGAAIFARRMRGQVLAQAAGKSMAFADRDKYEARRELAERREKDRRQGDLAQGPIDVVCEECGEHSQFQAAKNGTTQNCPHCGAYVDVGDQVLIDGWDEPPADGSEREKV